jgi:hypothetical protein
MLYFGSKAPTRIYLKAHESSKPAGSPPTPRAGASKLFGCSAADHMTWSRHLHCGPTSYYFLAAISPHSIFTTSYISPKTYFMAVRYQYGIIQFSPISLHSFPLARNYAARSRCPLLLSLWCQIHQDLLSSHLLRTRCSKSKCCVLRYNKPSATRRI